jgi:hypothetical protein
MIKFFALVMALFLLASCGDSTQLSNYTRDAKSDIIVDIIRLNPSNVYEDISPKFCAITLQNDTVGCTKFNKIGDTIYYIKHTQK